ncbi:MAG: TrkH family potassium uptake protein [Bacteroidales bacterium]|nr:TrkH family potassium uptake protein [Bacteroidales bacterium]
MAILKSTIRFIGFTLLGLFVLMMFAALIAYLDHRDGSLWALLISSGITLAAGMVGVLFTKPIQRIDLKTGFFIVTGCWVVACSFGALPFVLYGHEFTFVNALFESVSGFTTTGASVLNDIEGVPKGLLFWRVATAWIGGIGVVSLVSILISTRNDRHSQLAGLELSSIAKEYYRGRRRQFIYRILTVYVGLTLASTYGLHLAGMTWFDAITHAMSACSTCGFSTKNISVAAFDSPAIEAILCVSMLLAGINFSLIFSTFWPSGSNRKNLFNTKIVRVFLSAVLLGIACLTVNLLVSKTYSSFWEAFRVASFQMCSITTTTGFATADTNLWPAFSMAVIMMGSLVCGCSGSTSGGIKIDRVWAALRGCSEMFKSLTNPNKYDYVRMDGSAKTEEEVSSVISFIMLYLILVGVGMVVYTLGGMDFQTGLSASIACMGNVGPGFGVVGSMGNYSGLSVFLKLFSVVLMLLGRLEIYPILIVIGSIFKKMLNRPKF